MHVFTAYVATQHLFDLRREAEAEHLARLARASSSNDVDGGVGRWVGRTARRLSFVLDAFARRVDPIGDRRSASSTDDRRTRPLAA
jgi:hypothetical protein